jgi:hypothetical protein
MKPRIFTVCLLACFMTLGAVQPLRSQQSITLTFTGKNTSTGAVQTLDSIQVKCLTRSFDTTLIGVQQLILQLLTDVDNRDLRVPDKIVLSNNFGNPFSDKTSFYVMTTEAASISLEVFNVLGKKIIGSTTRVETGIHRFRFEGDALDPGIYFLTARIGAYQSTTKMLKIDRGGNSNPQLVYEGIFSHQTGGSFGLMKTGILADDFRFVGFAKGFNSDTIFATPQRETTYVFQLRKSDTIISAPTQIRAASADGAIILSWVASTSESSPYFRKYVITGLNENTNDSFTVVAPKGATMFVVDSLMNGTRYLLTVRSEGTTGQLSPDYAQIEWAPAVRQDTDNNGYAIRVYASTSTNSSAVDLYNAQGYAEVIPQTGQIFKDRGDLYVYAASNTSGSLALTSPSVANNKGLETRFSTNAGIAVNSLDDQLSTAHPSFTSYAADSIAIADAPSSSSMVYFGRLKRGTDFYFFRLLVKLGSNGRLVQGSGADRYVELIASFQNSPNVPFAKKYR